VLSSISVSESLKILLSSFVAEYVFWQFCLILAGQKNVQSLAQSLGCVSYDLMRSQEIYGGNCNSQQE